jgi:hypothetical protein
MAKAKKDTKKKDTKKVKPEVVKPKPKDEPKVETPKVEKKVAGVAINVTKKTKNFVCIIGGCYWRTYKGKDGLVNAKNLMVGRVGDKKMIVDWDDGKVKKYEARKVEMIRRNEKMKDKASASPGGLPDQWRRTFNGVPIK